MAIEILFRVDCSDDALFDEVMPAIFRAQRISLDEVRPVKVERGVKYTRAHEHKWTTLQIVETPQPTTEHGQDYINDILKDK